MPEAGEEGDARLFDLAPIGGNRLYFHNPARPINRAMLDASLMPNGHFAAYFSAFRLLSARKPSMR